MYGIHKVYYFIIVFPMIIGFLAGYLLSRTIQRGKIRNVSLALACGVIMGVIVYGSYHYFNYLDFRGTLFNDTRVILGSKQLPTDDATVNKAIDLVLTKETGSSGFLGFMLYYAQSGFTLNFTGLYSGAVVSQLSYHVQGVLAWVYWLIEAALILRFTINRAVSQARQPYSETGDDWYETYLNRLGNVPPESGEQFMALIHMDQYADAGKLIVAEEESAPPNYQVSVKLCQNDPSSTKDVFLSILRTEIDPKVRMVKGRPTRRIKGHKMVEKSITKEQFDQLTSTFETETDNLDAVSA